ncbi:MAG: AraC family transcriptional regulator [Burkholderiales bacterium]
MIETPQALPQKRGPAAAGGVDLLSHLLGSMHLSGMVTFRAEFREPWAVSTPGTRNLARALPFRTEHIIPFHVLAHGGCWLELKDREPVWLENGDAILMPYGDSHLLRGRQEVPHVPLGQLLPPPPWADMPVIRHGGSGPETNLICGFVQCDELLIHSFLRHLPALMHVSPGKNGNSWLAATIRHTAFEATHAQPGAHSMLGRLTELMFVEILREHMQSLSANELGWFAAASDSVVGAALKCLHTAPFDAWSIERLAHEVGASRTVLNERFKSLLGQPPMQYLACWRLQLAAQRLKSTDAPMKTVADQAGYESEAAFSRAFKRLYGLPPSDWRKQQTLR